MEFSHAERLSALDASFLSLEEPSCHMHIGAAAIFDAAPLSTPGGGIDIDRVRTLMERGMHRIPRYRQRLARVPVLGHPVWVDDERFNLAYHVRHTHLPQPGDDRQLKRLVGRLMSQQLDRGKPLWEMWVIEGLEGGRFAVVTKIHHCMIDGIGSVELTGAVMRPTPDHDSRLDEPAPRWAPRATPSPASLLLREMAHRARTPLGAVNALRGLLAEPREAWATASGTARGIVEAIAGGLSPGTTLPLNVDIGPHRRFDWAMMDLDPIRAMKGASGATVNDVALAILAGGLRRFLYRRGSTVDGLDFRVMVPVNVRTAAEQHEVGNRVAMLVVRLPLDEADPTARLARVVEETQRMKHSHQALGVRMLEDLSNQMFTALFTEFGRLASYTQPFNLVVTNIPGPQMPVYIEGARMLACYPLVPLFRNQALGVALFSYDGRMYWGFNADWDALPDLHDLVAAVETEGAAMTGV